MTNDQANAELHKELEERTFRALVALHTAKLVSEDDFAALCYSAGFSPFQIKHHMDVNEATMRG